MSTSVSFNIDIDIALMVLNQWISSILFLAESILSILTFRFFFHLILVFLLPFSCAAIFLSSFVLFTTHFIAMCTPYLLNDVRRSTQAWLHNLALFSTIFIQYDNLPSSKDNR